MRSDDLHRVPEGLPAPVDDGACDHLVGRAVPDVVLPATDGTLVRLHRIETRFTVVYAYPRTGRPNVDSPAGFDAIPGARSCTPQNCAFRDRHAELRALGATVFGLSTQSTEYQREMAQRLHLPYPVLSDEKLELTRALDLPTFRFGEWVLLERFIVILVGPRIEHVIYPVFPSDSDAPQVLTWIRTRAT